jgi:hypothetical protein
VRVPGSSAPSWRTFSLKAESHLRRRRKRLPLLDLHLLLSVRLYQPDSSSIVLACSPPLPPPASMLGLHLLCMTKRTPLMRAALPSRSCHQSAAQGARNVSAGSDQAKSDRDRETASPDNPLQIGVVDIAWFTNFLSLS